MRYLALLVVLFALAGCGKHAQAPGPVIMNAQDQEQWEINLVEMRIEKNEEFQDSTRTALPLDEIASFQGLNYFYPDSSLVFKVPLQTSAAADTVILSKRKGRKVPYLRRGTVSFHAGGRDNTLSVFGPADPQEGDYLWLPFYDATSGKETYGGGRYLDLKQDSGDTVTVDFNYAYNPLCDYNPEKYDCTLPPEDNRLSFAVRAGEKKYNLQE